MSRPTQDESIELERLELACARIYQAMETAEILILRLAQIQRRAPRLHDLIIAGLSQAAGLIGDLHEVRALLELVLDAKRQQRIEDHALALSHKERTSA